MKAIEYNKVHDGFCAHAKVYAGCLMVAVVVSIYFCYIFGKPDIPGWAVIGLFAAGWCGGALDAIRRSILNFHASVEIDEVKNSLRGH